MNSPHRTETVRIIRNTILNFTGNALYLISGIIMMPLIIRGMGAVSFGIFSLAWVVFGYFSILDFGLGRATTKFIAEELGCDRHENIQNILFNAVIFQMIIGISGAALLSALAPFLTERILNIPPEYIREARVIFYMVAFSIPVVMVSFSFRGVLEAKQRFDLINAVNIPFGVATFVLPFLCIIWGFGLKGIVFSLLVLKFLALIAWIMLSLALTGGLNRKVILEKKLIYSLFKFGGWVTVSNLLVPLFFSLDRFLIGAFYDVSSVAYYTAPYEVVARLWAIPSSLLIILFPAFSSLHGRKAHAQIELLFLRSLKVFLILIGLGAAFLIFFSRGMLHLWLGADFAQNSTRVFQILLIGFLMSSLANIPYVLLQGAGRPDITAKFNILEMVFYIPLIVFLVKAWGIKGAAIAWALRMFFGMLLLFYATLKLDKISILKLLDKGLMRGVLVLSAFVATGLVVKDLSWRIYGFIFLMFLFSWISWSYVLESEERVWLVLRIKGIFRKRVIFAKQ